MKKRFPAQLASVLGFLCLIYSSTLFAATVSWVGGSGDWENTANWNTGALPGPSDDVVINPAATITVTHSTGAHTVHSIALSESFVLSGGSLAVTTTLIASNTVTLSGGTLQSATVITTNGASMVVEGNNGSTLNGVTVDGTLDVGNAYNESGLTVLNGLILNGTMLVGNPTNSWWGAANFSGTQGLGGTGTVMFGNQNPYYNALFPGTANTTLTISNGVTIAGQNGTIGYGSWWGGSQNVTIINQGTIAAGVNGGTINVNGEPFINQGLAQGLNGGTISLSGSVTNSGTLKVIGGGLSLGGTWTNSGAIDATNGTVTLGGSYVLADWGTFNAVSNTINLTGTLNNTNTTLVLNPLASDLWVLAGGTILGGSVQAITGASLMVKSGTLDGVMMQGTLDIGNDYNEGGLTVLDGLTLNGTLLLGNPTNSWFGAVNFSGTQTLGGTGTVIFGNQNPYYNALFLGTANTTLTIGNGITIEGQNGTVGYGSWWGGAQNITIINQGAITAGVNGGTIDINGQPVLNQGLMAMGNGGQLNIQGLAGNLGQVLANGGGLTLSGTYTNNSTLTLNSNQTLTLNGNWFNTGTISATNATINLGGTFTVSDLGTFNRSGGTVDLTGTLDNTNTVLWLDGNSWGTWILNGGTIEGGIVETTNGASLIVRQGTLNGVTMDGTLDVGNTYNEGGLTVVNNLTLNGTILMGNPTNENWGAVNFSGTQTLGGNGTVIFGNQNPYYNALILGTANTTLTIGNGITITGQNGTLGYGSWWGGSQSISIINDGTILDDVSGGTIDVNAQTFGNQGVLSAINGGQLSVQGLTGYIGALYLAASGTVTLNGTYTNNSVLNVTNGATLNLNGNWVNAGTLDEVGGKIGFGGAWINSGTIDATNGTVTLGGSYILADFGTFNAISNTIYLTGTLDNTNTTFVLDPQVSGTWVLDGGTILGGTVQTTNGASLIVQGTSSTMNGVTMNGTLDVGNTYNEAGLTVLNGLTLNGTMLMGNPTNANWGAVNFSGTQTFGGTGTVIFGNQNPYYNSLFLGTAGTTLTIGSGITITGQNGTIGYGSWWGGPQNISIINDGTLSDDVSGGTIDVNAQTFGNQGVLSAINGGQLSVQGLTGYIGAVSLATSGTVTLNGTYTNNSVLNVTNGATLNLNGNWVNAGTLDEVGGKIGFGGTWINSGIIDATNGTVTFGGSYILPDIGTFNAISNTIYLTGTLDNTNTTFVLDPQVSGTWVLDGGTILGGTVQTTNGASLIVQGTSSTMNGVTMSGMLDVGNTYNESGLTVVNGLTLNGTMLMGNPTNENWGGVNFSGTQTFGGTGTVIFGNQNPYYNALFLGTAGSTLTMGSGISIEGQNGILGYGSWWGGSQNISIVNQGAIGADVNGGTMEVNAEPFVNQGTLSASAGTLSLNGTNDLSGTLEIGITGPSTYGHVNFAGNVSLGGIGLNITLDNGYQPASGSTFSILGYGSVSSVFGSVNFPSSGVLWQENYGAAGYTLTATNSVTAAVYLTSPANSTVFASSTNIAITAIATNTYAPISSVSFFEDGNLIGTSSTYPYGLTWSNAPAGIFGLTAQATDTTGATGTSLPIYITVLPTVSGTNYAWTGHVSSAWTNSGNWSPAGVPGVNDSATIANGGTVTISNAVGVAFLSLASGTINGPGLMNIAGSGDWTGGEIDCPFAVLANGVLNIGGSGTLYLLGGLTNAGTINWAGTANLQIYNYNGNYGYFGGINNLSGSMFNVQNDQSVVCACYGYEYFNNAGTIVKSPTTGTTTINVPFTNTGRVIARTGTITFNDGGSGNGQFAAATGANIIFAGGTMALAGPLQNVTFSGGTLDESGSISNLTWIGGTLGGNSVFSGTTTWTGGELGGNSTLTIATNGVFDINGGGTLYLLGAVTNAGTINWGGTANLQIYNYNGNDGYIGGINNLAGAVFNARNDQNIVCACYGYEYFNNEGTIIKSPTTGTTTIDVPFNNTGTVEVESGTMAFNDGGTSTGQLVAATGADTYIGGGTMALYGPAQNLIFSGGTINEFGSISNLTWTGGSFAGNGTVNGTATWTGGQLGGNSTLTIATNGVLNIGGNGTLYLYGALTNAGTINWTGTANLQIYNYNGNDGYIGGINNLAGAVFNAENDQSINCACYGYEYFNNAGTFTKRPTTGTTTIGVPFNNTGAVNIESGSINLNSGHVLAGGSLGFWISGATNYTRLNLSGSTALSGALNVNMNPGYAPGPSNSFALVTYGSESGAFASLNLPDLINSRTNYGPTAFTVTLGYPKSILGWFNLGYATNGTYTIDPSGSGPFSVSALMTVSGGGWTELNSNVAASVLNTDTNMSRAYLYVQSGTDLYYRTPVSQLPWSWTSGQDLDGTYYYSGTSGESSFVVAPSGEHQAYGVGGSSGGGTTYKCLVADSECLDPENAQVELCQDLPGIFGAGCQCGVTVYFRENLPVIESNAPVIVFQPTNQFAWVGSNAQFNVIASGSVPLFYRWQFDGTNLADGGQITGSESNILTISSATTNDAGGYSVVVTNYFGSVTGLVASLTVSNLPDLAPVSVSAPGFTSGGLEVTCVATNQGLGGVSGPWYDGLWVTTNAVFNESNAINVGYVFQNHNVPAGSNYTWTTTANVPQAMAGAYSLYVVIDDPAFGDVVYEETKTNNISSAIALSAVTPDLAPVSVGLPASGVSGTSIQVSCTVTNQGTGTASGPWADGIYFTSNAVPNVTTATLLTSVYENHNATANGSYAWTNSVNLPQVPAGTYYLFVVVDDPNVYGDVVYEVTKTNNVSPAIALSAVTPDLAPVSVGLPASGVSGTSIQVSCVVTNQGTGSASGPWADGIYFTSNAVPNVATATLLTSVYENHSVTPDGSYAWTNSVNLPQVPAGTYYLFVVVDDPSVYGDVVYEVTKTNNVSPAIALSAVTPDLAPVSVGLPASGVAGTSIQVSCVVTNQGTGSASGPWADGIYFTSNAVPNVTNATLLTSVYENHSVTANGSYAWTNSVSLPQVPAGTYYLFVVVDDPSVYGDVVYEVTKTNNVSPAIALSAVTPDLAPVSVGLPASGVAGTSIQVSCVVTNQGTGSASGPWADGIYFTSNAVPNVTNATLLTSVYENHSVTANGSYAWTNSVTLPQVQAGTYYLFVVVDDPSVYGNVVYEVTKTNNVSAPGPLQIGSPDLAINNVSGPANAVIAQPVQLILTITNQGTANAVGPWQNQILIANNPNGIAAQTLGTFTSTNLLTPGNFVVVTQTVIVPTTIEGTQYFGLFVNSAGNVPELNRSNNIAFADSPVFITGADLDMEQLNVPASAQWGQNFTVTYAVTNVGGASATANWNDELYLSSSPNTLSGATLLAGVPGTSPLASGTGYTTTQTVSVPLTSSSTPGNFYIIAVANGNEAQLELTLTNNELVAPISITLPPLPDLAAAQVTSPTTAGAGESVPVSWAVTNIGNAEAAGPWQESVYLLPANISQAQFATNANAYTLLNRFTFTNDLAPGESLTRTQQVEIPSTGLSGNLQMGVYVNSADTFVEQDETNNAALAPDDILVPTALSLDVPFRSVSETTPNPNVPCLVLRNGDMTQAAVVSLASVPGNNLTVPASVTIPAGVATAPFTMSVVNNGQPGPNVVDSISANADDYLGATSDVTIVNDNVPGLALFLASTQVTMGQSVTATLTSTTTNGEPVLVSINGSSSTALNVPVSVTIPADSNSVAFTVTAAQTSVIAPPQNYSVTASASGYASGSANLTVLNDNTPALTLSLVPTNINEADGPFAAIGTISYQPISSQPLTIALTSTNTAGAIVPAQIVIPALTGSATFYVAAVNDTNITGPKVTLISAQALDNQGDPVGNPASESLIIQDNNVPVLRMSVASAVVPKGANPATVGSVWTTIPPTNDLMVTLTSSETNEATVPLTITIPAGQTNATFDVVSLDDGLPLTSQTLSLTASATNYASGSAVLTVSDPALALPDLVIQDITAPASVYTDQPLTIDFQLVNQGLGPLTNDVTQNIYLTTNAVSGPYVLIGTSDCATLGPGTSTNESVFIPSSSLPSPGIYWVVVTANADNSAQELTEANNSAASSSPIAVAPEYSATVQTTVTNVLMGTPIPLSGSATRTVGGPATNVPVNILVTVRGLTRTISVITDVNGNFTTVFNPLATEAGTYTIIAVLPGITAGSPQGEFNILGISANPSSAALNIGSGGNVVANITLNNLSDVPLTDLTATISGLAANLTAGATLSENDLAGQSSLNVSLKVAASDASILQSSFTLQLASAEGVVLDVPLSVTVTPPQPQLVVSPTQLRTSMLVGGQTVVQFEVANNGGADSGTLAVALPSVPWMNIASGNTLPSLAPGESNLVTLVLTPSTNVALGPYTGNLAVNGSGVSVQVPFSLDAVSDAHGSVLIQSVDELTFFSSNAPPLTNASVTLTDPFSGDVVASGVTDTNGLFLASGLMAGTYALSVAAPQHSAYNGEAVIQASETNTIQAFLSLDSVTYTWTVTPTQVQVQNQITVTTTFETDVPDPVIVPTPASLDLSSLTQPGQYMDVPLTLANEGLIGVQNVSIGFASSDLYQFDIVTTNIGNLPAHGTVTIPLRVTYLGQNIASSIARPGASPGGGDGPCTPSLGFTFSFPCGLFGISKSVELPLFNFLSDCTSPTPPVAQVTTYVTGPGVSPGGNGGPGGSISYSLPAYSPPTVCDCNLLPTLSAKGSVAFNLSGTQAKLLSMLSAVLPDFTVKVPDFGANFSGSISSCCYDNTPSWTMNASATLQGTVTMTAGPNFSIPTTSFSSSDPNLQNISVNASGFAGVQITAEGSVTGTATRTCAGEYQACVNGKLGLSALAGGKITAKVSATEGGVNYSGQLQGTLGLNVAGSVTASGCIGGPSSVSACANLTATASLSGQLSASQGEGGAESTLQVSLGETVPIASSGKCSGGEVLSADNADTNDNYAVTNLVLSDIVNSDTNIATALGLPTLPQSGVCAQIQLQLSQNAVLTENAFNATLQLSDQGSSPLTNIAVNVVIQNALGQNVTTLFDVQPPTIGGGLSAVDGTGMLTANGTGSAEWILIPTSAAAPQTSTNYLVSGSLSYTQNGVPVTIPLTPEPITVQPSPQLYLSYFIQQDVYGDDPFTPEIEPSIPFAMGLMIQNQGYGTANNFQITSSQPTIVDNKKGLLIGFNIIGTQVDGQPATPSLTANFGNLAPQQTAVGVWNLTSTLDGQFTAIKASYQAIDPLGKPSVSFIDGIQTHIMTHLVQAAGAWDDGLPDFLVIDNPNPQNLPDTVYLSSGPIEPVSDVQSGSTDNPVTTANLQVHFTADFPAGFSYVLVPDPANGQFGLTNILCSGGTSLLTNDFWMTYQTLQGVTQPPLLQTNLHLFVYHTNAGPDTYTLQYGGPVNLTDTNPPVSSVFSLPAESPQVFGVAWNGAPYAGGASIAYYDIYISDDGGPFTDWQSKTTANSALFTGANGHTYAFYSVATDTTGNRETAPSEPQAETTVIAYTNPPTISLTSNVTLNAGQTLSLPITASDPNPESVLTFSLAPGAPYGATVNADTGYLTWTTSPQFGGTTNRITVIVSDNSEPPLTATGTVSVFLVPVANPPMLVPIPNYTIREGRMLTFTNYAIDENNPPRPIKFSLGAGAPDNASIDSVSGVFEWQPTEFQVPSTNIISVIVADNGNPQLSAEQTFTVIVREGYEYTLSLGSTNLLVGTTNSVPINLQMWLQLTNISAIIDVPSTYLTNVTLQPISSNVADVFLQPLGTNIYALSIDLNSATPQGTPFTLAQLGFTATSQTNSAVVPLGMPGLSALDIYGQPATVRNALSGDVFVIGVQPLLNLWFATNSQPMLTLYGNPDANYEIDYITNLMGEDWQVGWQFPMTNTFMPLNIDQEFPQVFYRAIEFHTNSDLKTPAQAR
jgi:CARDB/Immunoglobulin domain